MEIWTKLKNYPKIGLILLAYLAFIALGMPDGLLGVAWPSVRTGFNIPLDAIGVLLTASVAGYTTSGFFSGPVITRLGVGRVLVASCLITGLGLIGYTLVPVWWMMVALGVLAGLGAGAIDAGLNTYVASHFGEGLMQWLHASYGIGVTLGPIIMTIALTSLHSWHIGYQIVGGFQLLMATCFVLTLAMWDKKENLSVVEEPKRLTDYKTPMLETMRQSQVWLSVLLFFLYVGAEGTLGIWTYSLLIESRGVDPAVAGFWAGSYWATFTIGRVVAGLYARRIGVNLLVLGGLGGAFLGSVLLLWNPFQASSLLAVALVGFSVAPIFPALMSGTSKRVGEHFAANTIGLQMASTGLGMAAIPGLLGVLAKRSSLEVVPIGLVAAFAGLFCLYVLAIRPRSVA